MSLLSSSRAVSVAAAAAAGCCAVVCAARYMLRDRGSGVAREELANLSESWDELRATLDTLPSSVADAPLHSGQRVKIDDFNAVCNNSLWDAANNQYCSREGAVSRIDADGDVTVRLDSGEDMVCDVKFVSAAETVELRELVDAVSVALDRVVSQSTTRRAAAPIVGFA
jgi:hypothetical protein